MAASTAVTPEDVPPLADPTARTAQIAALTGLRGFAALMVVVVHVSSLTEYAWIGLSSYGPVSLFVLSGFLLYRPWARWGMQAGGRPSLGVFARRRLARIFPAYLFVVVAIAVIHPPARPDGVMGWVRTATLTWIYEAGQFPTGHLHTWSLATEVSWYLALPVLAGVTTAVARTRSPRTGFWTSVALISLALPVTAAWHWWVAVQDRGDGVPYSLWLPGYLACFAAGALVAHLAEGLRAGLVPLRRTRLLAGDPWALPVLALTAALLSTSALGGPPWLPDNAAQESLRTACATIVALALLVVAVLGTATSPVNRLLATSWFVAIGRWSYGIFLWHFPLMVILGEQIDYPHGPAGLAAQMLLVLGLSVPLGAATYAWVEAPAIRWSHGSPAPDQPQREPRAAGLRDTSLREASAPNPASSSVSDQPAAPNPAQPRRVSPGG